MNMQFLDTNVLVYANDCRDAEKQSRAIAVVACLMRSGNGVISMQVLQEYANTALVKLQQKSDVVLRQLRLLEAMRVVEPDADLIRRQVEIRETYGVSFWDAGIVAAAEAANCTAILSEDLNSGQFYSGIRVVNPFLSDFDLHGRR